MKLKGIRPILVKFLRHKVKSDIYFGRRGLKELDMCNKIFNDARNVYVNENLTARKRMLFAETRKKAKQYKWYNAWTLDGKVFLCKNKGDCPTKISSYQDLENIYV